MASNRSFNAVGNASSVMMTLISSICANVYGLILPILELSSII